MRRYLLLLTTLMVCVSTFFAHTIKVDKHGSGDYTSIQQAIDAATSGDTIRVLPEVYNEQVRVTKNIVLLGSGYENTAILYDGDPALKIDSGRVLWFSITSTNGAGVRISGGALKNCVVLGCIGDGVQVDQYARSIIANCVVYGNSGYGIVGLGYNDSSSVYNCIGLSNGRYWDFSCNGMAINYCNGHPYYGCWGTGNIEVDPEFVNPSVGDFHLKNDPLSPCINTGNPSPALKDPDGTRGDMGYFGGPDVPTYPVVTNMKIIPLPNGGIEIQATGRSNY